MRFRAPGSFQQHIAPVVRSPLWPVDASLPMK
jgi:hypothetical protein